MGERMNVFGDDTPRRPSRPGRDLGLGGARFSWKTLIPVLAVLAALLVPVVVFDRVPPDRLGVKHDLFGAGIIAQDLEPGLHVVLPGIHKLTLVDCTVKNYKRDVYEVPLSDKSTAQLDYSVVYRIKPGEAHLAVKEISKPVEENARELVRIKSEKAITEIVAKLVAEDLFDVALRRRRSEQARDALADSLRASSLEVIDVLLRNVTYPRAFEQKLLDRQLLEQGQLLEQSKKVVEQAKEITERYDEETIKIINTISSETKKMVQELEREYQVEIARIRADAQAAYQAKLGEAERVQLEKSSAAQRALVEAEAYGDKLRNAAYAGAGGELYLTKLMIEALEIGDLEINTNQTNPFDVREMLRLLGAPTKK